MKTIRQILRQPVKSLFGMLLIAMAVAILCICVGQGIAAGETAASLEHNFSSVVLPAVNKKVEGLHTVIYGAMPEELRAWVEETAENHPDVIKDIVHHGIVSAYIPKLQPLCFADSPYLPDNFTNDNYQYYFYQPKPYGAPYSCAMLVMELEQVSEVTEETRGYTKDKALTREDFTEWEAYIEYVNTVEQEYVTRGYTIDLVGTVKEVVSLQEGFRDPTGMTIRMTMTVPTLEEIEVLQLTVGEQYLVYGMDYFDEDRALRGLLADKRQGKPIQLDAFDLSKLELLSEEELSYYRQNYLPQLAPVAKYAGWVLLTQEQYEQVNSVSMTLNVPIPLIEYEDIRDETGNLLEIRRITDRSIQEQNGTEAVVSEDVYVERYQIPTISRLEGSVQDFLQADLGEQWQQALERDTINNQAFGVIGVEKLGYIAEFARGNTRITGGRDFTEKELTEGEKVCVINEVLAASNGLEVGDTINVNFYQADVSLPYQWSRYKKNGILNPTASFYFRTTSFTEEAEYTIVGLYRSEEMWGDVAKNEYIFSPNTIFVPKNSVQTEMETHDSAFFSTLVIWNGQLETFQELAYRADYGDWFIYYDQGYAEIAGRFHDYIKLGKQVLWMGLGVYLSILVLFLILFPGTKRKQVYIMETLGETFGRRMRYLCGYTLGVWIPGTMMGLLLGVLLWNRVASAIMVSAGAETNPEISMKMLCGISLIQLIPVLILSLVEAMMVAIPRGMRKR